MYVQTSKHKHYTHTRRPGMQSGISVAVSEPGGGDRGPQIFAMFRNLSQLPPIFPQFSAISPQLDLTRPPPPPRPQPPPPVGDLSAQVFTTSAPPGRYLLFECPLATDMTLAVAEKISVNASFKEPHESLKLVRYVQGPLWRVLFGGGGGGGR